MKRDYLLTGLDCANCAAKIEREIAASEGVAAATVNFITGTLHIEFLSAAPKIGELDAIIRRIESGITITEATKEGRVTAKYSEKPLMLRLIMGAVIFAAGLISEHFSTAKTAIYLALYIVSFGVLACDILIKSLKNIMRGKVFDENFLMSIAAVGAFIIGEYAEAVGVILFYQTGELLQRLAVRRAKNSISALLNIRPDSASLLLADGSTRKTAPEEVAIGDTIIVRAGERVPLDGKVVSGVALLDTAALTGESMPRRVEAGDTVLSGSINTNAVLTVKVTETFSESTASKIIKLVESAAEKKAPTESFITSFARVYTPIVLLLAAFVAVLPPIITDISSTAMWINWIRRGLLLLVISCPCALVISIPLGFFGGLGAASRRGVLIKGGNYLEALNKLDIAVFDKTGTLTQGAFRVTRLLPADGHSEEELLELAVKAESFSTHPIAASILQLAKAADTANLTNYREIAGQGIMVEEQGTVILAGNGKLMQNEKIAFIEYPDAGTKVYVACGGRFAGCIVISDEIKPDSRRLIEELKQRKIRVVMLTGDNRAVAEAVAADIGIEEVYSGLLPADKADKLNELNTAKKKGGKVAFMGDGINDAPVLALSDIGISMGGVGSDAAVEAADMVIMNDEPSKLLAAIDTAGFTKRVVWQNIFFALIVKAAFLVLGIFGLATMWEAVFADVGVALIAVFNALRILKRGSKGVKTGQNLKKI